MTKTIALNTRNGTFRVALRGADGAPVLLLSNSLGTTLEMWEDQAAMFSSTHRVVCYDTRGHGGSPVTPGPYRFEDLGDDVLAIMDALHINHAVFCGISMGGHTALWLGGHAGERFSGIAVCNSAAKIGTAQAGGERASAVRRGGAEAMHAPCMQPFPVLRWRPYRPRTFPTWRHLRPSIRRWPLLWTRSVDAA